MIRSLEKLARQIAKEAAVTNRSGPLSELAVEVLDAVIDLRKSLRREAIKGVQTLSETQIDFGDDETAYYTGVGHGRVEIAKELLK